MSKVLAAVMAGVLLAPPAMASEDIPDQYPASALYSKPVEFIPNVFSAIGATAPPTYENGGHNNNLSFIITGDGVVVVNGGASWQLAEALHAEIEQVTEQPVRLVVNENGQGHAMLGNSYWRAQGVKIVAQEDAAASFEAHGFQSLEAARRIQKEKADKTEIVSPDETFTDSYSVDFGDLDVQVLNLGPAHSPGDVVVWLPEESLVISGDMAFHERLLPIFEETDTAAWLESWDAGFEALEATYVIPGHGHPTNMAQVRRYTKDYLVYIRGKIREHLDAGGDLSGAYYVDQSPYKHLDTFEELATRNAGQVFRKMEWE